MKYSILLLLIFLFSPFLLMANGNPIKSTRSASLGESGVVLDDFWSAFNNQAGLALINQLHLGLAVENRFLIKELSTYSLAFNLPLNQAGFGFKLSRFGNAHYHETQLGIAYGMKLSKSFSVGIQLDYLGLKQSTNYGSINTYYFEAGFLYELSSDLKLGAHLFNPHIQSNRTIEIPEIYQLGFSYRIQNETLLLMSIKYHSIWQISIHSGIEFQLKSLRARLGYSSKPEKLTFGLGYCYKKLSIDISNSIHSVLGNSPQISLSYEL